MVTWTHLDLSSPSRMQVGLVDGTLATIVVHRVAVNLPMELDMTVLSDAKLPDKGINQFL